MFYKLLVFSFLSVIQNLDSLKSEKQDYTVITGIGIAGNKITKSKIILRELDFKVGDTLFNNTLETRIADSKNKIINLKLFLKVDVLLNKTTTNTADLQIKVNEQGYFSPYPVFYLADRSFNEWWYNNKRKLNRTIFGIDFVDNNIGGRAQEMWLNLEAGFAQRAIIGYRVPYVDKAMKTGIEFDIGYIVNKQMNYKTNNDKQVFLKDENILLKRFKAEIGLSRRNNFYERQKLSLSFHNENLADTISSINPNYFLNGVSNGHYFRARYSFEGDHRNNSLYPTKGHYFIFRATKFGVFKADNVNQIDFYSAYAYYWPIYKNLFCDFSVRTEVTGPKKQAFSTSTAFGSRNENVRGYDLYVIDGQKYALFKSNIRYKIFTYQVQLPYIFGWKDDPARPIEIYLRAFYDGGYVRNRFSNLNNSKLANKYISGFGLGVDFFSTYTNVVRLSYSINDRGEKGLFINVGREF